MDIARYLVARAPLNDAPPQQLAFEAFYSYMLPQFEGIDEVEGERLYKQVRKLVGIENERRLRTTLRSVLGLELLSVAELEPANAEASDGFDGLYQDVGAGAPDEG
jgi:hypothetical protein